MLFSHLCMDNATNATYLKLPSLGEHAEKKNMAKEQKGKHASLSGAALPFLAASNSLEPDSDLASQILKAAFWSFPVSQSRCKASSLHIFHLCHLCPCVLLSMELRDAVLGIL